MGNGFWHFETNVKGEQGWSLFEHSITYQGANEAPTIAMPHLQLSEQNKGRDWLRNTAVAA
jgi:hypothetical protein